ncbi:MAG: Sec-independent protein translocase protein TatB [Methylococcales bacterium]
MFDIGFSELVMVGLVSLLVIGPERLPKVARIAGYWLGKSRQMVAVVKAEIKQELHEEEIRQALKHHAGLNELESLMDEASEAAESIKTNIERLPEQSIETNTAHEPK